MIFMVLLLLDMKNAFGITKKTLHPAFALRDEAPLKDPTAFHGSTRIACYCTPLAVL
jgi:hypothetical protein